MSCSCCFWHCSVRECIYHHLMLLDGIWFSVLYNLQWRGYYWSNLYLSCLSCRFISCRIVNVEPLRLRFHMMWRGWLTFSLSYMACHSTVSWKEIDYLLSFKKLTLYIEWKRESCLFLPDARHIKKEMLF